ncbi:MAG: hypothetical protein AB9872_06860 [Solidesulfovibrio sp.]
MLYKQHVVVMVGKVKGRKAMPRGRIISPWSLAGAVLVAVYAASLFAPIEALADKRAGAYWAGLQRVQKTDLILGIFDGFNLNENILGITLKNEYTICSEIMESIMRQSDAFFEDMPAGRIVSSLDGFYADKKNRNIPVSWGLWVVVRQNRKDASVGEFLQELRNLYP